METRAWMPSCLAQGCFQRINDHLFQSRDNSLNSQIHSEEFNLVKPLFTECLNYARQQATPLDEQNLFPALQGLAWENAAGKFCIMVKTYTGDLGRRSWKVMTSEQA